MTDHPHCCCLENLQTPFGMTLFYEVILALGKLWISFALFLSFACLFVHSSVLSFFFPFFPSFLPIPFYSFLSSILFYWLTFFYRDRVVGKERFYRFLMQFACIMIHCYREVKRNRTAHQQLFQRKRTNSQKKMLDSDTKTAGEESGIWRWKATAGWKHDWFGEY